jgi:hypothetical protein
MPSKLLQFESVHANKWLFFFKDGKNFSCCFCLLLCEEVVGLILCESRRRYAKVCRQKLLETEVEIEMKKEEVEGVW